jgi:leucine dehydrogenase
MGTVLEELDGDATLAGKRVVVDGVGHVGAHLARLLAEAGAQVAVADVNRERVDVLVQEIGAESLPVERALEEACDILAPCALGGVLNEKTIPRVQCRAVCGAANNQLAEASDDDALAERGILYAPDYVINAGGLINVADELEGYNEKRATKRVMRIYDSMESIIAIAKRDGVPTHVAADTLALERIDAISSIERLHTGHPYGLERRRRETL